MAYKCALCGKSYDTINERVACESACLDKAAKDAEAKQQADREKIKKELNTQIKATIDETTALIRQYREVTGEEPSLTTTYSYSTDKEIGDLLKSICLPNPLRWLF